MASRGRLSHTRFSRNRRFNEPYLEILVQRGFTLKLFSKIENMRKNFLFPMASRGRLSHTRFSRYRRFNEPYLEIFGKTGLVLL